VLTARRALAEFIGTFIVVFIAAGAVVADVFLTHTRLTDSFGPLGISAAYAFGVAVGMQAVLPLSGAHLNPVISISAYVSRRLSAAEAAGYVVAQVAGAIAAAYVVRAVTPKTAFQFVSGGVPGLASGVSVLQGATVEAVLTFFLAFTFWAVLVDKRGPRLAGPLAVGLVIFAGGLAGAAFSGGAMNPVRWLGPAVAGTHFANWLVWAAGPLLGALLGSLAYETLFLTEQQPELVVAEEEEEEAEEEEDGEEEPAGPWTPAPPPPPVLPQPAAEVEAPEEVPSEEPAEDVEAPAEPPAAEVEPPAEPAAPEAPAGEQPLEAGAGSGQDTEVTE